MGHALGEAIGLGFEDELVASWIRELMAIDRDVGACGVGCAGRNIVRCQGEEVVNLAVVG